MARKKLPITDSDRPDIDKLENDKRREDFIINDPTKTEEDKKAQGKG